MAKYVNSQTGILIETDCVIEGEFWEEVTEEVTEEETEKVVKKSTKKVTKK